MSGAVIIDRNVQAYIEAWKGDAFTGDVADEAALIEAIKRNCPSDFSLSELQELYGLQKFGFDKHVIVLNRFMGGLEGKRILDIGCGMGGLVSRAACAGAVGHGVDTFPRWEWDHPTGLRRFYEFTRVFLTFDKDFEPTARRQTCGTAMALPYPDHIFDAVTSVGMLEHIPKQADRRKVISEALRVLKPEGTMLLLCGPNRYFPFDQHYHLLPFVHWLPPWVKSKYISLFFPPAFMADPSYSVAITRAELRSFVPDEYVLIDVAPAWFALRRYIGQPVGASRALLGTIFRPLAFAFSWLNMAPAHIYVIRRQNV